MVTTTKAVKKPIGPKEFIFNWEGKDKNGKTMHGEMRGASQVVIQATLRRQGIRVIKVKKHNFGRAGSIKAKDIALFTRQLATMLKAGVPLLQAFDIVGKGARNQALAKLLFELKTEVETGSSLHQAFRKFPLLFDPLYCNLIEAGEQAGILDTLLDRLASYQEKIIAIKSKIKSALFYPISIVLVALVVTAIIMIFVIPEFKKVFTSFGADLPAFTLLVVGMSDYMVSNWYIVFGLIGVVIGGFFYFWKRSIALQNFMDRLLLQLPVIGVIMRKATIARWTRTLSTMFAAGVPLVEALDSVGGASGNAVYRLATAQIQTNVNMGTSLNVAMQDSNVFPSMVIQMVSIGEESGQLDSMLRKVADFFEAEVDDAVGALSSLMEPIIMAILGVLVGGLVIAMYLPIFKLGAAV